MRVRCGHATSYPSPLYPSPPPPLPGSILSGIMRQVFSSLILFCIMNITMCEKKKIILQFCFCCRAAPRPPPSKRKSGGQAATVNQLAFAYVVVILSITEINYVINTRLFALVSQRYRDLLPLHLFEDTHTRD